MLSNIKLAMLAFAFSSLVSAVPQASWQRRDGGNWDDYDPDDASPTTMSTTSMAAATMSSVVSSSPAIVVSGTPSSVPVATPASSSPAASATPATDSVTSQVLIGMNGDTYCTSLMCVGGLVNGSTIQYTLQSASSASVGWIAMGFGSSMAKSPMVIMWPNSDGSITLSQRSASGHVMPTVDPSPAQVATLQTPLSSLSGSNPKFVYTVPNSGTPGSQSIIWAFSSKNPGSSAVDASIVQHTDADSGTLDLTKSLTSTSKDPTNPVFTIAQASSGSAGSSQPAGSSNGTSNANSPSVGSSGATSSTEAPLSSNEKMIVAHAVLCTLGFLVLLPSGAIFARWLRTSTVMWFKGHWIIQFALAGPVIVIGIALICAEVGPDGFADTHMRWGLVIFIAYLLQISLGGIIHYIKPKSFTIEKKRPVQNYGHAVLGLLIIGLSFFQVRTGYKDEWPEATGRNDFGTGADVIWYIWVVVVPLFYFVGLRLLPKQLEQERAKAAQNPLASESAVNIIQSTTRESSFEKYRVRL